MRSPHNHVWRSNMVVNRKNENKLKVTQNSMTRSIIGVKLKDKISTKILNQKIKNKPFLVETMGKVWGWAGHMSRLRDNR